MLQCCHRMYLLRLDLTIVLYRGNVLVAFESRDGILIKAHAVTDVSASKCTQDRSCLRKTLEQSVLMTDLSSLIGSMLLCTAKVSYIYLSEQTILRCNIAV